MTTPHAKSNAREGDGVAGLIAKWREGADALDAMMFDSARAARIECYRSCADQLEAMQAQQGAEPVAWIPVGERLPDSLKPVLICVEVAPSGRRHVLRAQYAAPNTLELGDDQEWWPGCTESEDETVYCPAGWYERNQYDETSWHVSDAVIAWQPLPTAPATGAPR